MLSKLVTISKIAAYGALAFSLLSCGLLLRQVRQDEAQTSAQVRDTLTKLDGALNKINAPCVGFHGSVTCGTLAQIDQSVKNIGAMAAQSQQQVRQSAAVIVEIQRTLVGISTSVNAEIADLQGTTKASTGTLTELQKTLGIVNDPESGLKPLLARSTALVAHTDDAVTMTTPQVQRAVKAMADMGEQGVVVTTNAAKVTTHYEKIIDTPLKHTFLGDLKTAGEIAWKVGMLLK